MKQLCEPSNFNLQLLNLKSSLTYWDDLISKSNKFTAAMCVTIQCMSGFLEAFQKISDIAETNNYKLRPFGIALRRYCLRQRCVESRLRSLNSQITECLVNPLSDRLDEWRRTANQMDRDCVKELRKAKSELQRAMLEAEKCKKRFRRKQERSGVTAAFEGDNLEAPNVQINFVRHDLASKQRALEHLEHSCLEALAVEEYRRFAELSTCLNPLLDAQLSVLEEMGPLKEVLKDLRAAHPTVIAAGTSTSSGTFGLVSTSLVRASDTSEVVSQGTNNGDLQFDSSIATGSAALSFAATPSPSTPSVTSTNGGDCGSLFGHIHSIATLDSSDRDKVSLIRQASPLDTASVGLGYANSPGSTIPLLNGCSGSGVGGDSLSLFDHNQSISSGPTLHSASSSSSLGLLPINCDAVPSLGSWTNLTSSKALDDVNINSGLFHVGSLKNNASDDEEEWGGTTEGCLTEDDENDETVNAGLHSHNSSSVTAADAVTSTDVPTTEKSKLYPNQSLPPPVYTNISRLQAAAQRGLKEAAPATSTDLPRAETPPLGVPVNSAFDAPAQTEGRMFPQPTATILKGGMASLLRSLSISRRSGFAPPGSASLGDGEGLSLSPTHTSATTPINANSALLHPPPPPSPANSPSSSYFDARSRIGAIFSNAEIKSVQGGMTMGCRVESPSPVFESLVGEAAINIDSTVGRGAGDTFTLRRKRPSAHQRTAGINLMRGSMFQLNTASATAEPTAALNIDSRYGCGSKQTPMTPGPERRAPLLIQPSTSNEPVEAIRPPRRSSSVCRDLPSFCKQQQQFQLHSQHLQRLFPPSGLQSQQQQQNFSSSSPYAAPRVYADARTFQPQQIHGTSASAVTTAAAAAAQLAAEAASSRRYQQCAHSSGFYNPMNQRAISLTQNGPVESHLLQPQTVVNGYNNSAGIGMTAENPRAFFAQQHQHRQMGITPATGASFYGCSSQQFGQQQYPRHDCPPPPGAFDDVESTSFIEPHPPSL